MRNQTEVSPVYEALTFQREGNLSGPSFLLLAFDEQRIFHISVEELIRMRTTLKLLQCRMPPNNGKAIKCKTYYYLIPCDESNFLRLLNTWQ